MFEKIIKHKKITISVVLILIGIFLFFRLQPKTVIPTQIIKRGDIVQSISVSGSIVAKSFVDLSFQTSGELVFLSIKKGDTVYKGQAIAALNKEKLQANYRQAQQDFTAAKAASEQYYDANNDRTSETYDQKVQRTSLDAKQNKAYDEMVKAQKDLNNSTLYASIAGIVTRADVEHTGVNITPATVFEIVDPNSLAFDMDVDEADIGKVILGQDVDLSLDSYPDENIKLKINSIDFTSHTTSTGGNAYTAQALFSKNDLARFRIGMNGNADILIAKKENVITIPLGSLNENKVYVKTQKGFIPTKLTLGLQNDTDAQVLSGLKEGDIIATDPSLIKK